MELLISVIVPCFNHAHFLSDMLASFIAQKNSFTELLVIDDGSIDNTASITAGFSAKDSRIRYYHKMNGGLSSARNFGITRAKGNILHFIDADDVVLPNCYRTIRESFDLADDVLICGYEHFKSIGICMHKNSPKISGSPIRELICGNLGPPAAHFIKKSAVESIGFFDETLDSAEDWDFWFRAALNGLNFRCISSVLIGYRYSEFSMSRDGFRMYRALYKVLGRYEGKQSLRAEFANDSQYMKTINLCYEQHLLKCVGVEIMKGNVSSAAAFFINQAALRKLEIDKINFNGLSSYLSFRYFNTLNDIGFLLKDIKPFYHDFFVALGYSRTVAKKHSDSLFTVFEKKSYQIRFGRWLGYFLFRISRLK